jgi:molecular chaperone Hsp33
MIKKPIEGMSKKEQLKAKAKDRLHHFILADGNIRGAVVHGTYMIKEMRNNHNLGILETLALGQSYIAIALMTSNLKNDDRIAFKIQCDGPIKGLSVEANAHGEIRGYLKVNPIPIDKPLESFDLSPFFGTGFLQVIHAPQYAKHPYSGQVKLQYGRLASDLANYYLTSEQTPSAFDLSVQFDKEGNVTGAGGIMLQAMPGASPEQIDQLETLVYKLPSLGDTFSQNKFPEDLITSHFNDLQPKLLANRRIEFFCPCHKDTVGQVIAKLGKEELQDILTNGPLPVETICHNCNTAYSFDKPEIEQFLNS